MKNKISQAPDESIYLATLRLLEASGKIFASLISLSAVAYLMGWIAAKSYFVQFGAPWIATQLSPVEIFSHALTPLYYFLIALYLVLKDFDSDWPHFNRWETAIGLLAGYVVVPLFFGGFSKAAIWLRILDTAPFGLAILGAVIFSFVIIHFSRKNGRNIPSLLYFFSIVAVWLLPTVTGAFQGQRDREPSKSSLPLIVLRGNPTTTLRSLCFLQGRFYIFDGALPWDERTKIFISSPDAVEYLAGAAIDKSKK